MLLGSGKTLAFLLPIIEQLHEYYLVHGPSRAPCRPFGVVITPSRELTDQIYVRFHLCRCIVNQPVNSLLEHFYSITKITIWLSYISLIVNQIQSYVICHSPV